MNIKEFMVTDDMIRQMKKEERERIMKTHRDNFAMRSLVDRGFYREYLSSYLWESTRVLKALDAHFSCERCGVKVGNDHTLEVWGDIHHKHYLTLGKEELSDLECLCRSCHDFRHGK